MCRFIERSQIVMKKIVELDSIQKKFKEKVIFIHFLVPYMKMSLLQ